MNPLEPSDVGPRVGGDLPVTSEDKNLVLAVLDAALRERRLTAAQHAQRCREADQATTFDELIPLTRDLTSVGGRPASPTRSTSDTVAPTGRAPATMAPTGGSQVTLLALFSGFTRQGVWAAPTRITSLAVFGGGKLDLRQAVWTGPVIEVTVNAVFGGVDILVPAGTEVVNNVISVLGTTTAPGLTGPPNGRRLVLKGVAVFGTVTVKT